MSFITGTPSEQLKPFIKQYWAVENIVKAGEAYTHRVVSSGLPELFLYLDHKPTSDGRRIEENTLLNGQHNDYYDIQISENLSLFTISFQPQGVSQFFRIPLSELTNKSLPLKFINRELTNDLQGRISSARTFEERVNIAEEYFYRLLADNYNHYEFLRTNKTIDLIRRTRGLVDIESLSQDACLSRKQFDRKFMEHIGITPKQYLRIIRFQAALYLYSINSTLSMTQLAFDSGYYDQSHFINEFKSLTGVTPRQYFAECTPVSDFF